MGLETGQWPLPHLFNIHERPERSSDTLWQWNETRNQETMPRRCAFVDWMSPFHVCRAQSFAAEDFHVTQPHQRRGPASDVQASSAPVCRALRPDISLRGKEKHNKLHSGAVQKSPQCVPFWGQTLMNRRLNNSARNKRTPYPAPAVGGVPAAYLLWSERCVCAPVKEAS